MKNLLKNFDGVIAGAMMIVTILLVIVNVITRKLFNYIIIWSEEIATSCFVYSVFMARPMPTASTSTSASICSWSGCRPARAGSCI